MLCSQLCVFSDVLPMEEDIIRPCMLDLLTKSLTKPHQYFSSAKVTSTQGIIRGKRNSLEIVLSILGCLVVTRSLCR